MYRDTVFTIIVYPEMYRGIMILYRYLCLPVCPALCVSAVARALPWCCFGLSNTRVSPDAFSQDSPSKVFIVETSQLEGIPCHEWYSVLLGSTQLSLLVSTLLPVLSTRLETRGMCKDLSHGMKVNELVDLTTSEFVSEYPEENPNIVWSGRKHLETYEHINEPLDQVKPDSCFQSSDEGPSCFFFAWP